MLDWPVVSGRPGRTTITERGADPAGEGPDVAPRSTPVEGPRSLPSIGTLLETDGAREAAGRYGHRLVADALRERVARAREGVRAGRPSPSSDTVVAEAVEDLDRRSAGRLQRVVNATGVVLHTNLGRAPLSAAARAAVDAASGPTTLEYDLRTGHRDHRTRYVGWLAAAVCGAPAATVVNNGAAALVLVLASLAAGRETVVSRGELIEIGGSYRLPDVMAAAGTVLREVGTTNRTHLADYAAAIGDATAVVLRVHASNYRIVGFTAAAATAELARLAHDRDLPFVYDLGSGALEPIGDEPTVAGALADGADLVIVSGDKLIGGPQAGIIAGAEPLVRRCERHPLARAVRIGKLTRAALEATLAAHLRSDATTTIPVLARINEHPDVVERRARRIADQLGPPVDVVPSTATVGGGSIPGAELASWSVTLPGGAATARALRAADPPVIGRISDDVVHLDLRSVDPTDDDRLAFVLAGVLGRPVDDLP